MKSMMKKVLLLSTGGTFNKYYDEQTGAIAIDKEAYTLHDLATRWRTSFEISTMIGKDSLEMTEADRALLLETVQQSDYEDIVIIHGTDTMDLSAQTLAKAQLSKRIVFTGAMTPYRVDHTEASANVAMALGFLQAGVSSGVYISMNGVIDTYEKVIKNREEGRFELA